MIQFDGTLAQLIVDGLQFFVGRLEFISDPESLEIVRMSVNLADNLGMEAIALYAEHQEEISVVLMDLMIPNMDSSENC